MAKIAELPDGTRLEFPDDAPDEIVIAKAREYLGVTKERTWSDAAREGVGNIPSSAAKLGSNLVSALIHPVDTFEGIVRAGAGAMESAFPENAGLPGAGNVERYEALKQMIADRYGSEGALKNTVATDPVGMAADVAGLLSGGGGLVAKGGTIANLPNVARAGATVAKAGSVIDPVNVARQALTAPIRAIPQSIPSRLWNSAVKPNGKDFQTAAAQRQLFDTAVENQIPLSASGLENLRGKMSGVRGEVDSIIMAGDAAGETVNSFDVASRVDDLRDYYKNQAVPSQFVGKIDDVQYGFLNEHPQDIPVGKAQEMKQAIYHENRKKYGETRTAGDEAEKAIARGFKEELEARYPELKGLNAKQSKMIDLDGAIEDALIRIGKHQVLGLTSGMWGGAGYMAGGPTGAAASILTKLVMDSQPVKSRLALSLAAARKNPNFGTKGSTVRAAAANEQRMEE